MACNASQYHFCGRKKLDVEETIPSMTNKCKETKFDRISITRPFHVRVTCDLYNFIIKVAEHSF